jgi:hypothetical protein
LFENRRLAEFFADSRGMQSKNAGILSASEAFLTRHPPLFVEKDRYFDFSNSP